MLLSALPTGALMNSERAPPVQRHLTTHVEVTGVTLAAAKFP